MQRIIDLSIVIPVFNGGTTVEGLVDEIHAVFSGRHFEVVLVNDGSADDSEQVCLSIARRRGTTVSFVQLSRNFGEHNAVVWKRVYFSPSAASFSTFGEGTPPPKALN